MKLIIDIDETKLTTIKHCYVTFGKDLFDLENYIIECIKNGKPYEERPYEERPFITECRNAAIEKNLPLYFVYHEETGVFEVYVTETKELFEKRHLLSKRLSNYEFEKIVTRYLDDYTDWRAKNEKA